MLFELQVKLGIKKKCLSTDISLNYLPNITSLAKA